MVRSKVTKADKLRETGILWNLFLGTMARVTRGARKLSPTVHKWHGTATTSNCIYSFTSDVLAEQCEKFVGAFFTKRTKVLYKLVIS